MTLTFAETHNMVAYLTKSDASEGFNQIIDFLNRSSIKYALTVNLNIYVSCIKQFWTIVAVKNVNDVIRLQALVDKKKVMITEATIRDALRLDDAEGVECLPNEEIFAELARMGYEKPSTKLTFYKAFFSSQWKFLIHTILQCMSAKRTSWNEFSSSMVVEEGDADENDENVNAGDTAKGYKAGTTQRVEKSDETVMDDVSNQGRMIVDMDADADGRKAESQTEIYKIDLEHANKVLSMQEDESKPAKVQEVVDVVTTSKIINEVVTATSETITAASETITADEAQVLAATLTAAPTRVTAAPSRKRKGIVIRDPQEESTTSTIIPVETKSKDKEAELNKNIGWDEVIDHVKKKAKEDPAVKKYQALKKKPQTEAQARKNMMLYLKNVAGFKMDYFKGMSYDDIRRVAKRQKLDEEVEELKIHLQIVPNEDDDVYTEATLLARKVPVVDYGIIEQNNKPYYKIIRADALESMLLKEFKEKHAKCLMLLVKDLVLSSQVDAVD
nr:hypothetical protein [Tanacetum cinerariifolium]